MKNKKGIVWFIPLLIVVGILLIGGGLTAYKLSNIISSTPTWVWWLSAILLILMMLPKKK